jgi:hypothetical protein
MRFHIAAHFADRILDLALSRGKCVLDRDHNVLVLTRVAMTLRNKNVLVVRHCDANVYLKQATRPVAGRGRDDRYFAARDPAMEFFQMLGLFFDFGPDNLGRLRIWKADFRPHLHLLTLFQDINTSCAHSRGRGFCREFLGSERDAAKARASGLPPSFKS